MKVRDAGIRALRTAAQAFVGLCVLSAAPITGMDDVKGRGVNLLFALVGAGYVAIVSFAQCVAEDNTQFSAPK